MDEEGKMNWTLGDAFEIELKKLGEKNGMTKEHIFQMAKLNFGDTSFASLRKTFFFLCCQTGDEERASQLFGIIFYLFHIIYFYLFFILYFLQIDTYARIVDRKGNTPLHAAAAEGHVNIIRRLLSSGADINARNNDGCSPIFATIIAEKREAIRFLCGKFILSCSI